MTEYDLIADVYDEYTDGFSYTEYLDRVFKKAPFLPESGLALDCGCGTGSLMLELERRGFSCTGVDISSEMLEKASEKLNMNGIEPHLVCQSLEKIDLYGAYDICFCSLDTLNHLSKKQLTSFIGRLINFTEPEGYFVFDVKTEAMMKKSAGQKLIDKPDSTLILDCVLTKKGITNYITVFEKNGDFYSRRDSVVKEQIYNRDELMLLLKKSGFTPITVFAFRGRKIYISQNQRYSA